MSERFNLETHQGAFVSAQRLADYMDCDRRTITRMIAAGAFGACVKVGRSWRIPTDVAREKFHVERKRAS